MAELKAFAGLDKALGRMVLRDGRPRKVIAEVAGINPSMFSGFCSGRVIPSLQHLDRILTTLGVGVEELTYELRALDYRSPGTPGSPGKPGPPGPPLVVWPPFLEKHEGVAASELLTTLLSEVRDLLKGQVKDGESEAEPGTGPEAEPAKPAGRRRQGSRRPSAPAGKHSGR